MKLVVLIVDATNAVEVPHIPHFSLRWFLRFTQNCNKIGPSGGVSQIEFSGATLTAHSSSAGSAAAPVLHNPSQRYRESAVLFASTKTINRIATQVHPDIIGVKFVPVLLAPLEIERFVWPSPVVHW